jgi:hypothetical protein
VDTGVLDRHGVHAEHRGVAAEQHRRRVPGSNRDECMPAVPTIR